VVTAEEARAAALDDAEAVLRALLREGVLSAAADRNGAVQAFRARLEAR
jgi:hypothetical protein